MILKFGHEHITWQTKRNISHDQPKVILWSNTYRNLNCSICIFIIVLLNSRPCFLVYQINLNFVSTFYVRYVPFIWLLCTIPCLMRFTNHVFKVFLERMLCVEHLTTKQEVEDKINTIQTRGTKLIHKFC